MYSSAHLGATSTTSTFAQRFEAAVVRYRELGVLNAVRNDLEGSFKDGPDPPTYAEMFKGP